MRLSIFLSGGVFRRFGAFWAVVLVGIIMIGSTRTGFAYDNDTHFWLTFYLAKKAGYTEIQATQIASANVSVDFDKHTQPVTPAPQI